MRHYFVRTNFLNFGLLVLSFICSSSTFAEDTLLNDLLEAKYGWGALYSTHTKQSNDESVDYDSSVAFDNLYIQVKRGYRNYMGVNFGHRDFLNQKSGEASINYFADRYFIDVNYSSKYLLANEFEFYTQFGLGFSSTHYSSRSELDSDGFLKQKLKDEKIHSVYLQAKLFKEIKFTNWLNLEPTLQVQHDLNNKYSSVEIGVWLSI